MIIILKYFHRFLFDVWRTADTHYSLRVDSRSIRVPPSICRFTTFFRLIRSNKVRTLCRAVIDSGKRVPEDYCVAGADGQDIAEYYHPSITTLKYPRVETALQSVRTLFDLIDRKKVVKRQILSGTLIERESTRKL